MKLSLFSALATTLTLAAALPAVPVPRTDTDPTHGYISQPTPGTHIAPGAAFDFNYMPSADYCRSTYAFSVWLVTDAPTSLAPVDAFMSGHFFGRFDYPNYPGKCSSVLPLCGGAVPYPKNPPPPQLTMPDFSKSPGGFGSSRSASDQTMQLAVIEEWSGCAIDAPLGVSMSLTYVPVIYNATTSS
ncbi:hypothetical protein C8Q77DRAFT_1074143 [Trametes polyzona]|nr:hypothetical protein C8Q77DRAFT_1074143 [Trametes polyzona]